MTPVTSNSRTAGARFSRAAGSLWLPLGFGLLPVLMLRPWELPLPAIDFATNVSATIGSSSLGEAYQRLSDMVRAAGRHHPLWTFLLALRWWYFGEWAVLWHLPQMAAAIAVLVLIWNQLQRAGASRVALVLGVGCAAVSGSVFSSLEAPEVAEPAGLLLALTSMSLAGRFSAAPSAKLVATIVATATASALIKESFVLAVPAVLMTAAAALRQRSVPAGMWWRPLAVLALALALAVGTLVVAPALKNRFEAHAATGARYSTQGITAARAQNVAAGMLLPVTRNPLFPANVAYVLLAGFAIAAGLRTNSASRLRVAQLATLATWPVLGLLLYLPWPAFPGYYGLIGVPLQAAIVGLAFDMARSSRPAVRLPVFVLTAVFVGSAGFIAFNRAAIMRADGRLENRLVQLVRMEAANGITLVADSSPTYYAPSVGKFATIRHPDRAARVRTVDCSDAGASCDNLGQRSGAFLVFPDSSCFQACARPAAHLVTECAATYDYRSLRRSDRCRTALLMPGAVRE